MKAVLISIRPRWCELIADGQKTVEVRKTRPKLDEPFKCYIYCSMGEYIGRATRLRDSMFFGNGEHLSNGKVIGEFVCDTFVKDLSFGHNPLLNGAACLSEEEASKYADGKVVYGWHISDLKIYDKPKELREFGVPRPPRSWCYVGEAQP